MADTVITPSAYERNDSSAAGWAVAVIVLLGVILFGLFVWPGMNRISTGNASTPGAIDVNVNLPEGVQQGTGAGAGAGAQQGAQPGTGNTNTTPTPAP